MLVKIGVWNVRGLNKVSNQKQVSDLISSNGVSVCGVLETHLFKNNLNKACKSVFGNWRWISNFDVSKGGTRIIVGWDPASVNVMVIHQDYQVIHCFIEPVNGGEGFFCSFIYAYHRMVPRRDLWAQLDVHKQSVGDRPWVLMGDFNTTLSNSESSSGSSKITKSMLDFRDCVNNLEVSDVCMSGLQFTWNKNPGRYDGLLRKLDRVMCNLEFMAKFPTANAVFLPFGLSDHSPALLHLPELEKAKPKPFKFPNYLCRKDRFLPTVQGVWQSPVKGHNMFSVVSKLKLLKKPLRKLNFEQGNLYDKVKKLKFELSKVQSEVVKDSSNKDLRFEEAVLMQAYRDAEVDLELFLKQKAKVDWLSEGDFNTKYFHQVVKGRLNKNRIETVMDMDGKMFFGKQVGDQFVKHFGSVLGQSKEVESIRDPFELFKNKISQVDAEWMVRPVLDDEIKNAMFDISDEKAPGQDGFSSKFFKSAWGIVGKDVCLAVKDFFQNGKMLKEVNATVIALVPKSSTPQKVADFRPISCCNVLYKCISKVLVNRIKGCLNSVVDENQSAFIPGRQISDNILLSQELLRNYHRDRGPAKVAFKVDIQKAYDSVEWSFLEKCLGWFGFPPMMCVWIMECMTSTAFSVCVNGDMYGYFKGKRGLRQGDPLSPYLFTLVMEVLTLMIKRRVKDDEEFKFHWRCEKLKLTHLCFADDLLLFCHANVYSVQVLKDALEEFGLVSGLVPSLEKSLVFFGNVQPLRQVSILSILPFKVGKLPVKYLGVPLLSKRLSSENCVGLVDKVKTRLFSWQNKCLSFAGRLQLIRSVLSSLQVYWSSIFVLPVSISNDIERLMRGFLWSHGILKRGKAKVNWIDVCKPRSQGGLGIKSLRTWNIALISKHVWNIVSGKNSLWVKWVSAYRLCDRRSAFRNFWDLPNAKDVCWSWKKILQFRDVIREHIVCKLGNGKDTSIWFDNWFPGGPLANFISKRDIYECDLNLNSKVSDVVIRGEWVWPVEWKDRFPVLFETPPPLLISSRVDRVLWKTNAGATVPFSVKAVWMDLIEECPVVSWYKLVWFSQCIPRHSFMLWLAINGKLRTQDRLGFGSPIGKLSCAFCQDVQDSHSHLFFECNYPLAVWNEFKSLVRLDHAPSSLDELVLFLKKLPINKSVWSILQRLVLGALVYYLWQERNLRLFQKKSRSVVELCKLIREVIRLRCLSLKFKPSLQVRDAAELWGFYVNEDAVNPRFQ
jgi:hypothetical protein